MNEEYTGWGLEDNSLCMRMFMSELTFDIIDQREYIFTTRGEIIKKN
jgi:hypothetical protein